MCEKCSEHDTPNEQKVSLFSQIRSDFERELIRLSGANERLSSIRGTLTDMLDGEVDKCFDKKDISGSMGDLNGQVETLSDFVSRLEGNIRVLEKIIG